MLPCRLRPHAPPAPCGGRDAPGAPAAATAPRGRYSSCGCAHPRAIAWPNPAPLLAPCPRDLLLQDQARLEAAIAEEQSRLDAAEREKQQAALLAEMEGGGAAPAGGGGGGGEAGGEAGGGDEDALDAFMSGVETQMEKDKVGLCPGLAGLGLGFHGRRFAGLPATGMQGALLAHD
jgi:hypothetical protein